MSFISNFTRGFFIGIAVDAVIINAPQYSDSESADVAQKAMWIIATTTFLIGSATENPGCLGFTVGKMAATILQAVITPDLSLQPPDSDRRFRVH